MSDRRHDSIPPNAGHCAPRCAALQPVLRTRLLVAMLLSLAVVLVPVAPALAQGSTLPRIGDAAGTELSPATERRIGEAIMRGLRRDRAMIEAPELTEYLNRFAAQLTDTMPARGHRFEFFLLQDDTLNAFALPGGYIGVHSGLLLAASTESELASVLAHEIGHVTQRHVARMLASDQRSSVLSLAAVFLAMLAASSSPDAAAGLVALGSSVYEQQMLSFSRDAEREADRIGLEILREAGFSPNDMIAFFARMQQATRIYENGAPTYMRTHPLTSERMADIQNRLLNLRYRQRASSLDFNLVRERLQALGAVNDDMLQALNTRLEARIRERTFLSETATWYGLALVAQQQRRWRDAQANLQKARDAATREDFSATHPMFERLAASIALDAGRLESAASLLESSLVQFPNAAGLLLLRIDLALKARRYEQAVTQIEARLGARAADPLLYERLARAYAGLGREGLSHWATGEQYSLMGGFRSALEQFQLARKDRSIDFYRLSQIDARISEMRRAIEEENAARQRVGVN